MKQIEWDRPAIFLPPEIIEEVCGKPVFIIVGPTGSGKTVIIEKVLESQPRLKRVITTTTRKPRFGSFKGVERNEINGVDYHFRSVEGFLDGVQRGHFIEYDVFARNYYGCSIDALRDIWQSGDIPLMTISLRGVAQVTSYMKTAEAFFIKVPEDQLLPRLEKRGRLAPEELERRLAEVRGENSTWHNHCRHVIDNPDGKLDDAVQALSALMGNYMRGYRRQAARTFELAGGHGEEESVAACD